MDPGEIVGFLRVLGDRYVRASDARDDLSSRLEALDRRRRSGETVVSGAEGSAGPFDEVTDIEGARGVLYRSTRVWTERTRALEVIVASVVVEAHRELPAGWSPAQLRPAPPLPPELTGGQTTSVIGSEPTRGWWAWPES
ncbi:MAG: hypothetical protein WD646_01305 [Actinomycetota bacterium]